MCFPSACRMTSKLQLKKARPAYVWAQRSLAKETNSSRLMIAVHDTPAGVTFAVKVHPRAKKNAITGELGDALKLSVTAPPVDRKANEACIGFFAKLLKVPRSSVTIAAGLNNRN